MPEDRGSGDPSPSLHQDKRYSLHQGKRSSHAEPRNAAVNASDKNNCGPATVHAPTTTLQKASDTAMNRRLLGSTGQLGLRLRRTGHTPHTNTRAVVRERNKPKPSPVGNCRDGGFDVEGFLLYGLLLSMRVFLVLLPQPGYIHPDEFFQSPEVVAGDVFGINVDVPWEFRPAFPIRSIVFPGLVSGVPFAMLRGLTWALEDHVPENMIVNYHSVLIVPRLTMLLLSVVGDVCVFHLSGKLGVDPWVCLCAVGSSVVTLVFQTRPFSNSIESVLLSLALCVAFCYRRPTTKAWWLGMLIALGFFNRPTFLLPAAPLVLHVLAYCRWDNVACGLVPSWRSIAWFGPTPNVLGVLWRLAAGGMLTATLCVLLDTWYFRAKQIGDASWPWTNPADLVRHVVITPLNFLAYNTNTDNLAQHGLHFRGTHAAVNMPMLFGPLYLAFLASLWRLPQQFGSSHEKHPRRSLARQTLLGCIFLVLFGLSVFPHQEPRFLLCLLVPLVLLFCDRVLGQNATMGSVVFWIVSNFVLAAVLGLVHQGGVVGSLDVVRRRYQQSKHDNFQLHAVYAYTYMPPKHLALFHDSDRGPCPDLMLHDLKSTALMDVQSYITSLVTKRTKPCSPQVEHKEIAVLLVLPAPVVLPQSTQQHFSLVYRVYPHISAEAPPPEGWEDFGLHVYERRFRTLRKPNGKCEVPIVACSTNS
eukprot:m.146556 g.146556  ORF g.146556 m.146556 type:complete len:697 (-) comp17257_c1_seq2:660-2750(-)